MHSKCIQVEKSNFSWESSKKLIVDDVIASEKTFCMLEKYGGNEVF